MKLLIGIAGILLLMYGTSKFTNRDRSSALLMLAGACLTIGAAIPV